MRGEVQLGLCKKEFNLGPIKYKLRARQVPFTNGTTYTNLRKLLKTHEQAQRVNHVNYNDNFLSQFWLTITSSGMTLIFLICIR